ncbi:UDP-N-acetylglucosamine 2-epimerase [compost metagenome]
MTLRDNTERPETTFLGTNELIGTNPENIKPYMNKLFSGKWKEGTDIPFWDGAASKRIIDSILKLDL